MMAQSFYLNSSNGEGRDVKIKFVNDTGDTDFRVVVYAKPKMDLLSSSIEEAVAWQVIQAQSTSIFVYPNTTQVGAEYQDGDQTVGCGPFEAEDGSTWCITQEDLSCPAILSQWKECAHGKYNYRT